MRKGPDEWVVIRAFTSVESGFGDIPLGSEESVTGDDDDALVVGSGSIRGQKSV
jgi:hypothetical protein